MASVLVPVFYVLIVFGGLFIFGRFYRKRSASTPQAAMSLHTHPRILQTKSSNPTFQDITRETPMSHFFSVPTLLLPMRY